MTLRDNLPPGLWEQGVTQGCSFRGTFLISGHMSLTSQCPPRVDRTLPLQGLGPPQCGRRPQGLEVQQRGLCSPEGEGWDTGPQMRAVQVSLSLPGPCLLLLHLTCACLSWPILGPGPAWLSVKEVQASPSPFCDPPPHSSTSLSE